MDPGLQIRGLDSSGSG